MARAMLGGLGLGLGAGAFLGWLLAGGASVEPGPAPGAAVGGGAASAASFSSPRLALDIAPLARRLSPPATTDAMFERALASAGRGGRGFELLGMLYAFAGQEEDLLTLIELGFAAGVDADRILDLIAELPRERRAAFLDRVLAQRPDAGFDPYDLARLYEDAGAGGRALEVVRGALAEREGVSRSLTRLLLRLDPQGGPALLLEAARAHAWSEDSLRKLRGLLAEAGQEAALLPFLQRVLGDRPGDLEALAMLAALDPRAARAHATSRLAGDPGNVRLWDLLGSIALAEGDSAEAFRAFKEAARLAPSPETLERLLELDPARALPLIEALAQGSPDAALAAALARACLLTGDRARAAALYLEAYARDPRDAEWIDGLIAADPDRAAATLARAIEQARGGADDETLGAYARALAAAGRTADAFEQYLAAHQRDPGDHAWQLALARLDPARALGVLAGHVRAHGDDASGRGAYGLALVATGRRTEGSEQLERALAEGNALLWYREYAAVDPERALAALRARAERDRRRDELWGALGEALARQGRTQEAREAYRRALAAAPDEEAWAAALAALR